MRWIKYFVSVAVALLLIVGGALSIITERHPFSTVWSNPDLIPGDLLRALIGYSSGSTPSFAGLTALACGVLLLYAGSKELLAQRGNSPHRPAD